MKIIKECIIRETWYFRGAWGSISMIFYTQIVYVEFYENGDVELDTEGITV